MIDYSGGFFLGLQFGLILIVLAVEAYYLIFEGWIEKELTPPSLVVLLGSLGLSVLLAVTRLTGLLDRGGTVPGILPVLPVPAVWAVLRFLEHRQARRMQEDIEKRDIARLEETLRRYPDHAGAHVALGDIHFRNRRYAQALSRYRSAYCLQERPYIKQRMDVAARQKRLQEGEIWVCPGCGLDNPRERDSCGKCGRARSALREFREELRARRADIRKDIRIGGFLLLLPFAAVLLIVLLRVLPAYVAFVMIGIVVYLILRRFFSF